jgi:NDP-sugar pyrophosphorylase family protein
MCEAIILAGGFGSRLRGVLPGTQKVVAPVAGRPFVSFLFDQLRGAGIRRVVLCTGYLGEQVEAKAAAEGRGLTIAYSREDTPLGTAGAARLGLEQTNAALVLVMNGDSYCDASPNALLRFHRARNARVSMVLTRVSDTARFGRAELGDDDAVVRFAEKTMAPGAGWISAGVYSFARSELAKLPLREPLSLERDVLPKLIGRGLYGFRSDGVFVDIGTPQSYVDAGTLLTSRG